MPRVTQSGTSRPTFYDRNAANQSQQYSAAGVAPPGATTRWTYTVPAGKKAVVQWLEQLARRATVAAPVGTVDINVQYTPNGGSGSFLLHNKLYTNVANDTIRDAVTAQMYIYTGDAIAGVTSDGSTGGTVDYEMSGQISQFDA